MATVVDLLRQLAQDRAPDRDILHGPLTLPPRQRSPYALDLPGGRGANWSAAVGRPTTSQHALGIVASRAGEGVAFVGGDGLPAEDALLVVLDHLRGAGATAFWLVPDAAAAGRAAALLQRIERRIELRWLLLADAPARPAFVQLIVATYDEMHGRLLPFADRAWRYFWRGLRVIAMPELDRTNGLVGAHLRWLLRRAVRLAARPLAFVGASAPLAEAAATFQSLLGRACRVVDSTVGPAEATLLMTWRCDERYQTLDDLTKTLRGRGLSLVVVGRDQRDDEVLRSRLGATNIATVQDGAKAAIALVSGVPADAGTRDALLRSGYRMVVMLVADEPHELLYADDLERLVAASPALVVPDDNLFVTSFHLQAAAAELPLDAAEIDRWRVAERTETLVNKARLRVLNDGALQPTDADLAPILQAATSNETFVQVRDPRGTVIAALRPAVADWRGLPGATWAGDLVVAHRDDEPPTVDLAVDERRRLAFATATYAITPRTKIETRDVTFGERTTTVIHWNVEVRQRVVGLEEHVVGRPPVTPRIAAPLDARWVAHGCAIGLAVAPDAPTLAGWSLNHALVIETRCASEDIVVTYDVQSRSLWLIETAPGGTGIADWTLAHLDHVFLLARTLARLCADNDLLRTLAERELAWLEPLIDPNDRRLTSDHRAQIVPTTIEAIESDARPTATTGHGSPTPVAVPPINPPPARARVYAAPTPTIRPTPPTHSSNQQAPAPALERTAPHPAPAENRHTSQEIITPELVDDEPEIVSSQIEVAADSEHRFIPLPDEAQQVVDAAPAVHADDARDVINSSSLRAESEQDAGKEAAVDEPSFYVIDEWSDEASLAVAAAEPVTKQDEPPDVYDEDAWNAPMVVTAPSVSVEGDVVSIAPPGSVEGDAVTDKQQVDDIAWSVGKPVAEVEDVQWEAEPATQLPLDADAPAIPPLGRERPALNDGASARSDRSSWRRTEPQRPAPRASDDREAPAQQQPQTPAPARQRTEHENDPRQQPSRSASPPIRRAPSQNDQRQQPSQNQASNNRRPSDENISRPRHIPQQPQRPAPSQGAPPRASRPTSNERQPERAPRPATNERPPDRTPRPATNERPPDRTPRPATNERPPDRVPPPKPAPAEPEPSANVGSMIARMRSLREAREREQVAAAPVAPRHADTDVPLRFRAGQHIRCVPYGEGVVQSSEAVDGREQVKVLFPEIGTLTVDPDINFVRVIEPPTAGNEGIGDGE